MTVGLSDYLLRVKIELDPSVNSFSQASSFSFRLVGSKLRSASCPVSFHHLMLPYLKELL